MKSVSTSRPLRLGMLVAALTLFSTSTRAEDDAALAEAAKQQIDEVQQAETKATGQEQQSQIFGRPTEMDYAAKHFALAAGAALLNRFDFEIRPRASCPDTGAAANSCFLLKGGSAAPAFVLEASYRNRWAWEDRSSGRPTPPWDLSAAQHQLDTTSVGVDAARAVYEQASKSDPGCTTETCTAALRTYSESKQAHQLRESEVTKAKQQQADYERFRERIDALEKEIARLEDSTRLQSATALYHAQVKAASAEAEAARKAFEKTLDRGDATAPDRDAARDAYRSALSALEAAESSLPADAESLASAREELARLQKDAPPAYWAMRRYQRASVAWGARPTGMVMQGPVSWNRAWHDWLLPEDWDVSLGYAFVSRPSGQVFSDISGSNVLAGISAAYNVARWTHASKNDDAVPIRGAISLEGSMRWVSDNSANDVHQRILAGMSLSFGVPIDYAGTVNVVELVARIGALNDEVPVLVRPGDPNDNEVIQSNGVVRFEDDWGWGFDVEFNVPVSRPLGYIFLRGGLAGDIDPNPWFIAVGYTIPLGTLAGGIGL